MELPEKLSVLYYDKSKDSFLRKTNEIRTLRRGEVLIRIQLSGLCYTDVGISEHVEGCGLGHEGVGEVARLGDEVTKIEIADRVGWG